MSPNLYRDPTRGGTRSSLCSPVRLETLGAKRKRKLMGIPDPKDNPDFIRKEFPANDCTSHNRFVAFCDILGFSELVRNGDISELAEKYDAMLREAKASCLMVKTFPSSTPWKAERYRANHIVFSDSILLWSNPLGMKNSSSIYDATSFINYLSIIFGIALKMNLPLRIGIAYGKCVINPDAGLYLGLPIIYAYQTEQAQDWVGVACHSSCIESPYVQSLCFSGMDGWQHGPMIEYLIPIKDPFRKSVSAMHTIDWPFWGQSGWGGTEDIESLLNNKVKEFNGTSICHRWEKALEYCRFRLSKWKEIRNQFSNNRIDEEKKRPTKKSSGRKNQRR